MTPDRFTGIPAEINDGSVKSVFEEWVNIRKRPARGGPQGTITVQQVWGGVVTSCAWHSGQIALTNRLIPQELKTA